MATQPFDKNTIDKVTEAFKKLNAESDKTLSNLEESVQAEQKMVNIAKQLGQIYKTQQDKLNDQLKGKNLQEKIQLKLENSEKKFEELSSARINSLGRINNLENELLESNNKLIEAQSKDPLSSSVKDLKEMVQKKQDELNLEKQLLTSSKATLSTLEKQIFSEKLLNDTLQKTVKLVGLIAGTEFLKDLNVPKSINDLLSRTYSLFKEIDKSATDLRKQFGLFRSEAVILETNIREIVIELGEFGVKAEDVSKSISSIGKTFNYIDALDKSIVKDVSLMSKQMGISEEKSSKFLKAIGGIKGQSGLANKNMLSMAGAVATAYGVGLDEIMSDIAESSDDVRMYSGKNADEMVRAAAQARQMGTTLDNMAKTASSLLDFESSIQSELKASALIGKNINFNEARRLAFQGKVVEANKVILDQAKKIKFNQLNPIAQDAFAKAAGKTVKELQDMLESESRMKSALVSNNKEVRDAAKAQLDRQNLLKTNGKLAQEEYEKNLLNRANQERIVVLQNRLNAALQKIMLPVLEALTDAMENLVNLTDGMNLQTIIKDLYATHVLIKNTVSVGIINVFNRIKSILQFPFKTIKDLSGSFNIFGGKITNFLINKFSSIKPVIDSIKTSFQPIINIFKDFVTKIKSFNLAKILGIGDIAKYIRSFETLFPFLSKILSKIPLIGNVVTAIQFLYEAWKNVSEIFANPNLTGTEKFIGYFKAITKAAYTTLVEPFIDIGKWIGEKVFGSIYDVILDVIEAGYNVGANIWNGIKSVYSSVVNGIKNMFSAAWDGIKDWLGFSPSVLGLSIVKGIVSIEDTLISAITSPFTKAFELIKSGLELIWEKMKGIGSFISETVGKTFNFVGRIIGASEESPSKTTTETKTSVKTDDLLISTIIASNKAIADKLDKLTSMMASGQIAVYIDGQRANQILASTSQKFGSFGQATT